MAIVYSMKTARSLLSGTDMDIEANKNKSKAGKALSVRNPNAINHLYSDLNEETENKLIWETATYRPNVRHNFIGADWDLMIKQLAERYDVRNMSWAQLDEIGRLWVQAGLLSANEYASMMLVSRLKVTEDGAHGYMMLKARPTDEAFNVFALWSDRAAGLSVISSGMSYEGAECILKWLSRMNIARAAYVNKQRELARKPV